MGVGSKDRLKDAPPSADMEYTLTGAKSCIIMAYPFSLNALENYFSKKERKTIIREQYTGYSLAWKNSLNIS